MGLSSRQHIGKYQWPCFLEHILLAQQLVVVDEKRLHTLGCLDLLRTHLYIMHILLHNKE